MRYTLSVSKTFSAAHALRKYRGKCERLHGHTWKVKLSVSAGRLGPDGMAVDFAVLKSYLDEAISGLDHRYLNEVSPFLKVNPTAENIARHLFLILKRQIRRPLRLSYVEVWESENSSAAVSD